MNPISVPDQATAGRPECQVVRMGPPAGVSEADCRTVEMLVSPVDRSGPLPGRRQYAYYRPTADELDQLRAGGFIEFCQIGTIVQPFSAAVWPAPPAGADDAATRP